MKGCTCQKQVPASAGEGLRVILDRAAERVYSELRTRTAHRVLIEGKYLSVELPLRHAPADEPAEHIHVPTRASEGCLEGEVLERSSAGPWHVHGGEDERGPVSEPVDEPPASRASHTRVVTRIIGRRRVSPRSLTHTRLSNEENQGRRERLTATTARRDGDHGAERGEEAVESRVRPVWRDQRFLSGARPDVAGAQRTQVPARTHTCQQPPTPVVRAHTKNLL